MVTRAATIAGSVPDPELPMLTIADLGILRSAEGDDERAVVTITPTYSGCPAMEAIRSDIAAALSREGFSDIEIHTVYAPAWTSDWMTPEAREKLAAARVAPPEPRRASVDRAGGASGFAAGGSDPTSSRTARADSAPEVPDAPPSPGFRPGPAPGRRSLPLLAPAAPRCPRCSASDVEEISRFGPAACLSLWRCRSCAEPFEHFKAH